jgi:hypothetical protein
MEMNNYRVDRAEELPERPVGMNSILYCGDNYSEALHVYRHAEGGKDAWNQPNRNYGVMLSKWDGEKYAVKMWKNK